MAGSRYSGSIRFVLLLDALQHLPGSKQDFELLSPVCDQLQSLVLSRIYVAANAVLFC